MHEAAASAWWLLTNALLLAPDWAVVVWYYSADSLPIRGMHIVIGWLGSVIVIITHAETKAIGIIVRGSPALPVTEALEIRQPRLGGCPSVTGYRFFARHPVGAITVNRALDRTTIGFGT